MEHPPIKFTTMLANVVIRTENKLLIYIHNLHKLHKILFTENGI